MANPCQIFRSGMTCAMLRFLLQFSLHRQDLRTLATRFLSRPFSEYTDPLPSCGKMLSKEVVMFTTTMISVSLGIIPDWEVETALNRSSSSSATVFHEVTLWHSVSSKVAFFQETALLVCCTQSFSMLSHSSFSNSGRFQESLVCWIFARLHDGCSGPPCSSNSAAFFQLSMAINLRSVEWRENMKLNKVNNMSNVQCCFCCWLLQIVSFRLKVILSSMTLLHGCWLETWMFESTDVWNVAVTLFQTFCNEKMHGNNVPTLTLGFPTHHLGQEFRVGNYIDMHPCMCSFSASATTAKCLFFFILLNPKLRKISLHQLAVSPGFPDPV